MKKNPFSLLLAISFSAILFACAGHNNGPFPDHINLSNPTPAEQAMHAAEFRTMDSLAQIGLALAMQDGLAWIASDSISVDFPESRLRELSGWVAQGNVDDGFCLFYGKTDSGFVQIARYDFVGGAINRSLGKIDIPEGKIYDLVKMNDSANTFFNNSSARLNIRYNSYILEKDGKYTYYAMPATTGEYAVYGGAVKLSMGENSWNLELLHKSPIPLKWKDITGDNIGARTSSMGDLLNEADFAQYYITWNAAPQQIIQTKKYTILLARNNKGQMSIMVAK